MLALRLNRNSSRPSFVGGSWILTTVRQLKLTRFPMTLARVESGRKRVLIVEGWAEIRRLRRSEGCRFS